MTNSIAISKEDKDMLYQYIGIGWPDAKMIILGNEPGLASRDLSFTLDKIRKISGSGSGLAWGGGVFSDVRMAYTINEAYANPTTSEFARFITRLSLAIEHKDERFLGELSIAGKAKINDYIYRPLRERNVALLNLRPLPRPTEDTWIYKGIDKKEYNKEWNFRLKRHQMTDRGKERMWGIRDFTRWETRNNLDNIVIGVGDKENKKAFYEKVFHYEDDFEFHKANLDSHSIYFNLKHKIILSDYFNSRNGIKLRGLRELYNFLLSRKLI